MTRVRSHRLRVAALATIAAVVTFAVAEGVFPYHTSNHDEGVYLQQAAMLLEGQLYLRPPVPESFRPWFFVAGSDGMYAKYSPVTAATFAAGKLLGGYRVALALVAAACVALTARVGREAFDRRTGLVAAGLLLASPLFLVQSAVFLPYVPTTLWNLIFAAAYLQADRTGSHRAAALAGLAAGVAFFARPYTAVLFAAPFVAHALWTLREFDGGVVRRQATTATLGLVGVLAALGYNAVVTGDPLVFPYEAFAPRDGLGFGHREILGYSQQYTPALALRVNAEVLWVFATRWVPAGALGTLAAVLGFGVAARRGLEDRQVAVAGVGLTVPLGNVYFWGNRNVLGRLDAAGDGLIHFLGPYYHVDLLLPTVLFGAVGIASAWGWLRSTLGARPELSRRSTVATLVLCAALVGTAVAGMAADPLAENHAVTEEYRTAYDPVADRSFDDALVFLPAPYGDWLNHPFQALRNDPGYDGDVVYALRERQFAVVDAFPERTLYRYTYRGPWSPTTGSTVEPHLQPVNHATGESVRTDVEAGVPAGAQLVTVRLAAGNASAARSLEPAGDLSLVTVLDGDAVTLRGPAIEHPVALPVSDDVTVETTIFVDYGTGSGFTYRLEQPVRTDGRRARALTPYLEVCRGATLCGGESAYVPGTHREGIRLDVEVRDTT